MTGAGRLGALHIWPRAYVDAKTVRERALWVCLVDTIPAKCQSVGLTRLGVGLGVAEGGA
ncbi:MAG: hypothetical protein QW680_12075 [Pyrobaculum sp.]